MGFSCLVIDFPQDARPPPLLCRCCCLYYHLTLVRPESHPGRQAYLSVILHDERTAAEHLVDLAPRLPLARLAGTGHDHGSRSVRLRPWSSARPATSLVLL